MPVEKENAPIKFEVTGKPSTQDKEAVASGLSDHASEASHPWDNKDLGVFYRDQDGNILAGLVGETYWKWLSIKHIWVSAALRGQGIGKSLLKEAENEAKRRGCKFSTLDTYSFQSPEFYKHMGYQVCAQMENFPEGHTRIFYAKTL